MANFDELPKKSRWYYAIPFLGFYKIQKDNVRGDSLELLLIMVISIIPLALVEVAIILLILNLIK